MLSAENVAVDPPGNRTEAAELLGEDDFQAGLLHLLAQFVLRIAAVMPQVRIDPGIEVLSRRHDDDAMPG